MSQIVNSISRKKVMQVGDIWMNKLCSKDGLCLVETSDTFLIAQSVSVGGRDIQRKLSTTVVDPDYLKKHYKRASRLSFKNFLRVRRG